MTRLKHFGLLWEMSESRHLVSYLFNRLPSVRQRRLLVIRHICCSFSCPQEFFDPLFLLNARGRSDFVSRDC